MVENNNQEQTKQLEEKSQFSTGFINDQQGQDKILAVIDNLADGLMVFDEKEKLSLINPAAQKFFNVKEQALNKTINEFLNFPGLKNLFYLLGKEIKEVFRREIEINKDLILEISSFTIKKQDQKIGSLVIIHDITREKTIEKMKSEFVSISAHQLRTPLSEIKWSLETLSNEKLGQLTEVQKEILEKAHSSNKRMLSLVDDLLDVVRIEEGTRLYKLAYASLEEIVQSVLKIYQDKISKKQIKFEFQAPIKKLPKIKVDAEKMFLVVQNFLDNAIKYSPVGGQVAIDLTLKEKEIELSVKDTGIGIPKNQQQNIFEKFFRGKNAVKKEPGGNGLGLFIAKNIIDAHHGKIWFESEEKKGTTFYFSLPIK
jgi:PAS domain S-box-containing protein